jgi:hypothetical protein
MTKEAIELAFGKALLEEEFRNLLFAKPEEALSGFSLSSAEKSRLLRVDSETLEFLAQILNRLNPPAVNSSPDERKTP